MTWNLLVLVLAIGTLGGCAYNRSHAHSSIPRAQHDAWLLHARYTLQNNNLGLFTVPAQHLYPYQWNWDSAFVALGWARIDERRAFTEIKALLDNAWEDGMVPHIVFRDKATSYYPGPDVWQAHARNGSATTGITQPPIAATILRILVSNSENPVFAREQAAAMYPTLLAWHRWFWRARDPMHTGLVASLHPWETGMDNSPMWDRPLQNMAIDSNLIIKRQDTGLVNRAERPTQSDYQHYITLLIRYRDLHYDANQLYAHAPFRVSDVCTNSVLLRATRDLQWLAALLEYPEDYQELGEHIARSERGLQTLFDKKQALFMGQDQLTGMPLNARSSAGFLPLFAHAATSEQVKEVVNTLRSFLRQTTFAVPSLDPMDHRFDPKRYWRGPVWANINWMIADGLRHYGYIDLAQRIEHDTRFLTQKHQFYEYYNPFTGSGEGGYNFSWTAAIALWLQ